MSCEPRRSAAGAGQTKHQGAAARRRSSTTSTPPWGAEGDAHLMHQEAEANPLPHGVLGQGSASSP